MHVRIDLNVDDAEVTELTKGVSSEDAAREVAKAIHARLAGESFYIGPGADPVAGTELNVSVRRNPEFVPLDGRFGGSLQQSTEVLYRNGVAGVEMRQRDVRLIDGVEDGDGDELMP